MRIPAFLRYVLLGMVLIVILTFGTWIFYRARIIRVVTRAISSQIQGQFVVKDIGLSIFGDFPNISLTLVEPRILDTLKFADKKPLFEARKVYLQVQTWKLFRKELSVKSVVIRDGSLSLVTLSDTTSNVRFLQSPDTTSSKRSSVNFSIQHVRMENVRVSYQDLRVNKSFAFQLKDVRGDVNLTDSLHHIRVRGPAFCEGLVFNANVGGYLSRQEVNFDFDLAYTKATHELRILPSGLDIAGDRFALEGSVWFTSPIEIRATVRQPNLQMTKLLPLLTINAARTLSRYQVDQPFSAQLFIHGKALPGNTPPIEVSWETKEVTVRAFDMVFSKVSMRGSFINNVDSTQLNNDQNSSVTFSGVSGQLQGLPFRASIRATNLIDTWVDMAVISKFNLKRAQPFVDAAKMKLEKGLVEVQLRYVGDDMYLDSTQRQLNGKVTGTLRLTDGSLRYLPRRFHFTQVNTLVGFSESDIRVNALHYAVNGNEMTASGYVRRFVPFLFFPEKKIMADVDLTLGPLDLSSFISPTDPIAEKKLGGKSLETKVARTIEEIIDRTEVDMKVTAPEVVYGHFKATEVKGGMAMTASSFHFANLQMQLASGRFQLSGSLNEHEPTINQLQVDVKIADADVQQLFHAFDNFHQRTIGEENLRGNMNADIAFRARTSKAFKIIPESMAGTFYLHLRNGQLLNFEPLRNVSKVLFKRRNFMDISFAAIENRFQLREQELHIQRMELQSNVLTLFLEGIYSFRDRTDLSIQVPLSNLKRRDADYVPELVGPNAKVGSSVYLRARNRDGKMHVGLDLFNQYRKDHPIREPTDSLPVEAGTN